MTKLNIGQYKCPDCGQVNSTSVHDVCICKEVFDFPKIHIFKKELQVGDIFNYVDIEGNRQSIEIIDVDNHDKNLATIRKR